jgi:RND family efflux transporter MFP subunit
MEKIAKCDMAKQPKRALLSLATGAGKTFIAVNLLKRISDAGQLTRALFVCDRDELRTQALKAFQNFFGSDAAEVFRKPDGTNNAKNARIHIATYQTLGVENENGDASFLTTYYPENYFTHIVIDQTPGLIPGEELETWKTKVLLAASDVASAKAALNQANLNLHDAYVRAPFPGIIQTRTVQTGQYVQTGTVLATLVRRDPLLLRFKVPEREAAQIKIGLQAAFKVRDSTREYAARVVHVAAAADDVTRLVAVTAEVSDTRDSALRPGSFAEITVPVSSERRAPVIPQTAIRPSDRGFLAYVIENDKAVERVLSLGMRTAEGQVEVLSGLTPGETLVIRGGEALRSGAPVRLGMGKPQTKPAVNRATK